MNNSQNITAALGLTLVGANFWTKQRPAFVKGALNSSASSADEAASHTVLKQIALELLFVGVATLIAGGSGSAASAMVAVMTALAIVWAIKYYNGK